MGVRASPRSCSANDQTVTVSTASFRTECESRAHLFLRASSLDSFSSATITETLLMNLQIALMALATLSFLVLLFATIKFYKNARVIDSPENITASLSKLEKSIARQNSTQAKYEARILSNVERLFDEGFRQLHSDVNRLVETSIQVQKRLLEILGDNNKNIAEIDAQISALRQHSAEQQALLSRFQQGYDYTINKGLISGLIRTVENIDERAALLSDSHSLSVINEMKDNLLIALESQNVDQFNPPVGDMYSEHVKVSQAIGEVTSDPEKNGTIASVLAAGYVYTGSETPRVVKPAKVAVYMTNSGEEEGVLK